MNYTEITSMELVHSKLGLSADQKLPDVSEMDPAEAKDTTNSIMMKRMVKALNMDDDGTVWEPDYTDGSSKFYPWFDVDASKDKPGGFGFSYSYYGRWTADTSVGSRLCFKDLARLEHAKKYFEQLYVETLLILK